MIGPLPLLELIPDRELRVGQRLLRLENCNRCRRDQTIEYQLQRIRPRLWARRCLECSRPPREP